MLVQPGVEADTLPTLQGVEPGKGLTLELSLTYGQPSDETEAALRSIAREIAQKAVWQKSKTERLPAIDIAVQTSAMTGPPYEEAAAFGTVTARRLRAYVFDELTAQTQLRTPLPEVRHLRFNINPVMGDDTNNVHITVRPASEPVVLGKNRFFLPAAKDLAADALIREGVKTLPALENAVVVAGHGSRGRLNLEGREVNPEGLLAYLERQGILTFTLGTDGAKRYDVEYLVLEACEKIGGEHGTFAQELAELTGLGVVTPSGVVSGMGPFTGQFLSTQTHVMADGKIVPALPAEVKPWTLHRRGQDPQALKNDLVESLRELNLKPVVAKQPFKSADHNQIINFAKTEAATDSSVEPSGTEQAQDQQSDITPALTKDQVVGGIVSDVRGFRSALGDMERGARLRLREPLTSGKLPFDAIANVTRELEKAGISRHLSEVELARLAWVAAEIGHVENLDAALRYVTSMTHGLDSLKAWTWRFPARIGASYDVLAKHNPSALKHGSPEEIRSKVLALASVWVLSSDRGIEDAIALAKRWESSTVDVGSAGRDTFLRWASPTATDHASVLGLYPDDEMKSWEKHNADKKGTWRFCQQPPLVISPSGEIEDQLPGALPVPVGAEQPLKWAGDLTLYVTAHASPRVFNLPLADPTRVRNHEGRVSVSPKHHAELIASDPAFQHMLDLAVLDEARRTAGEDVRPFSVVLDSCMVVQDVGQVRFSADVVASHLAERVAAMREKEFEDAARELAREVGFADWDGAKFGKSVREFVAASSRLPLTDASAHAQEMAREFAAGLGKSSAGIDPKVAVTFAEGLAKAQKPIPEGMRLFASPYKVWLYTNGVFAVEAPPGTADGWLEFPVGLPVRGRVVPRAGVGVAGVVSFQPG
ncbi:hypothetical protein, partial [Streptomyces sp. NPDC000410]|uniref:hypothetical protein n=1 Tax=Streptomyces sp. NPDC000410 TaxID=3154254 RepID=UPI00331BF75F